MERLEQVRDKCLVKSVLIIQRCWRRHKRRVARERMAAAVVIQSGELNSKGVVVCGYDSRDSGQPLTPPSPLPPKKSRKE